MNFDNLQINFDTKNALPRLGRQLYHVAQAGLALLLAVGLNMTGFGFMAETAMAYYGDYELSAGNSFTAAMLDFSISNNEREGYIGLEADGDIDDFSSVVQSHPDSLDIQYAVRAELVDGDPDFCQALDFKVIHTGTDFSDGKDSDPNFGFNTNHSILDVTRATTTDMGTYEFKDIDLSDEASAFAHGTKCDVDLVFTGWRDGIDTPAESGYTDEERISLRLKNRMVVMNEFLPNPDGEAYGVDFGHDSTDNTRPKGEWIELYNNSEVPQDVSGWYFRDDTETGTVSISAGNTKPATTTVPAEGWLVVYMQKAFLNNTGDTFMLKDDSGEVVDEYTYGEGEYCEKEPSPNATNTTAASGDCNSVPPNKSYARIPDGLGAWVDPIPTPGEMNTLDQPEELSLQADVMGTSTAATTTATSSDKTASSTEQTNQNASSTATSTDTSSSTGGGGDADGETAGTSTATTTDEINETASSTTATSTDDTASSTMATSTDESATSSDLVDDTSATTSATTTDDPTPTSSDDSGEGAGQKDDSDDSAATTSDPIESEEKATSTKKDSDTEDPEKESGDSNEAGDEEDKETDSSDASTMDESATEQDDEAGKIDEADDSKEDVEEPIEKKEKTKEEESDDSPDGEAGPGEGAGDAGNDGSDDTDEPDEGSNDDPDTTTESAMGQAGESNNNENA
ncbi:MAG: lamin tail domain-containing protein [Candidatus Paceibacterota bacterium]